MKVSFLNGSALQQLPPESSKDPDARHVYVHEGEELDTARLQAWIKQAAQHPAAKVF